VYTVRFPEAVFVLHCFQKKSKRGIETPREHVEIIRTRLRIAEQTVEEWRDEKKRVDGVEVLRGSGNVFADLGVPDAQKLKIKTGLVIEIRRAIRRLDLTQKEAATRMGLTQPKVSSMMRGDFSNLSERKLMDCLTRLGYDIKIEVKPAKGAVGQMVLAVA
jgi:predicted XRE-type DNA-binding protein